MINVGLHENYSEDDIRDTAEAVRKVATLLPPKRGQ
jgi:hypothetical protein